MDAQNLNPETRVIPPVTPQDMIAAVDEAFESVRWDRETRKAEKEFREWWASVSLEAAESIDDETCEQMYLEVEL